MLAIPVANVHARGRDPFVSATRTGGTGGGDGDVIFEVVNVNDASGIVNLQVTEIDNSNNAIASIQNTPANWGNTGIVVNSHGKGIQTTWLTTTAPVTTGTSLNGFDVKMNGQAPYGWSWVLTDQAGTHFTGTLSVS